MPKKALPEGEDPLNEKYNSGLRMLLRQNVFYKVYAAYIKGEATKRSNLIREDLNDGIKKRLSSLSPKEIEILKQRTEEEVALIERKRKEKAAKKASPSTTGAPRPQKVVRKVRSSA